MRIYVLTILATLSLALLCSAAYAAPEFRCGECHSKNPAMRAMHEALEYKGCLGCHATGAIWPREQLRAQRLRDPLCMPCHSAPVTRP